MGGRPSCRSVVRKAPISRKASGVMPPSAIGNAPSQRAARAIGRLLGHTPATQIGTWGCTGSGAWAIPSTSKWAPWCVTPSPDQKARSRWRASSSTSARRRRSVSSPTAPNSSWCTPRPTPRVTRPPDRWSSDVTSRATFHGRRRARGVTIGPRRTVVVSVAMAARAIHGSVIGGCPARAM